MAKKHLSANQAEWWLNCSAAAHHIATVEETAGSSTPSLTEERHAKYAPLVSKCIANRWRDAHRLIETGEATREEADWISGCLQFYQDYHNGAVHSLYVDEVLDLKYDGRIEAKAPVDLIMYGEGYSKYSRKCLANYGLFVNWVFSEEPVKIASSYEDFRYHPPLLIAVCSAIDHMKFKMDTVSVNKWFFKIAIYNPIRGEYSEEFLSTKMMLSRRLDIQSQIHSIYSRPKTFRSKKCHDCPGRAACESYTEGFTGTLQGDRIRLRKGLGEIEIPKPTTMRHNSRAELFKKRKKILAFLDDLERHELGLQAKGKGLREYKAVRKKDGKMAIVPRYNPLPDIYGDKRND